MKIVSPHAYSLNDKIDEKGLAKLKDILDAHVTPFLSEYNKVPNIDGQIEVLNEDRLPMGKFDAQIKSTLRFDQKSPFIDVDIKFLAYCERMSIPVLLIYVSIEESLAYWEYMDQNYLKSLKWKKNKSKKRIDFKEQKQISQSNKLYLKEWRDILIDLKNRLVQNETLQPIESNVKRERILSDDSVEKSKSKTKMFLEDKSVKQIQILKMKPNFPNEYVVLQHEWEKFLDSPIKETRDLFILTEIIDAYYSNNFVYDEVIQRSLYKTINLSFKIAQPIIRLEKFVFILRKLKDQHLLSEVFHSEITRIISIFDNQFKMEELSPQQTTSLFATFGDILLLGGKEFYTLHFAEKLFKIALTSRQSLPGKVEEYLKEVWFIYQSEFISTLLRLKDAQQTGDRKDTISSWIQHYLLLEKIMGDLKNKIEDTRQLWNTFRNKMLNRDFDDLADAYRIIREIEKVSEMYKLDFPELHDSIMEKIKNRYYAESKKRELAARRQERGESQTKERRPRARN